MSNLDGVTDSDVRNSLEKWGGEPFDLTAKELMIRNPKTISGECYMPS